jgi:hypothetical protein
MLDGAIVLEGTWLYAGTTPSRVVVLRRDRWYGTGDHEDPPEVAEDREIEMFEVRYDGRGLRVQARRRVRSIRFASSAGPR